MGSTLPRSSSAEGVRLSLHAPSRQRRRTRDRKGRQMATRRKTSLALSAEQAQQALTFLVHEGKLAASEVRKAFDRREKVIREIKERMAQLGVGPPTHDTACV